MQILPKKVYSKTMEEMHRFYPLIPTVVDTKEDFDEVFRCCYRDCFLYGYGRYTFPYSKLEKITEDVLDAFRNYYLMFNNSETGRFICLLLGLKFDYDTVLTYYNNLPTEQEFHSNLLAKAYIGESGVYDDFAF